MKTVYDKETKGYIRIRNSEEWFYNLPIKERNQHLKEYKRFISNISYALTKRMKGEFSKEDYDRYMADVMAKGGIE